MRCTSSRTEIFLRLQETGMPLKVYKQIRQSFRLMLTETVYMFSAFDGLAVVVGCDDSNVQKFIDDICDGCFVKSRFGCQLVSCHVAVFHEDF